ncbi:unnamed protein product [Calicophoron daubneyi]|uniref:WD repeat-containing protein 35 n=1 Tax=Calicophoron daubneyi TaxID=300641 RepID=A0AAV2TQF1_CALDB
MFAYLSKKIAIPNNKKLKSIAWSKEHGYIVCGGEDGLLKVLKLEIQNDCKSKGLAAQTNLVMNQTLEGHSGFVQVITWNEKFKKITTSDQQGLIIVWMLHRGAWYEEMINNRNKSVVCSMKWDTEGHRICIVYEDGAAIVGSVDGNRIWGKELKCGNLVAVEWSPDGRILLFGLITGEVYVYDYAGNFLSKITIYCLNNIHGAVRLVGLHWYHGDKGFVSPNSPTLAICYDIGRCQLMRNQDDADPILLDTGIEIACASWNENGALLAVAGLQKGGHLGTPAGSKPVDRDINVVQFYSAQGDHLRSLCLPGKCLTACAWEGNGSLRLALAVDSFIYFANLRPDYKWAYCSPANTIVYNFTRAGSQETFVVFWNTKHNQTRIRPVNQLTHICGAEDYVCLVCKNEPPGTGYTLKLCNALGVSLDSKRIQFEPLQVLMTGNQVIAVTRGLIYAWQFSNPKHLIGMRSSVTAIAGRQREGIERLCHIDTRQSGHSSTEADDSASPMILPGVSAPDWSLLNKPVPIDPICAIAISGRRHLFVARVSGRVNRYRLPDLWFEDTIHTIESRPYRIQVNCNATRIAIVDESGILTMHPTTNTTNESPTSPDELKQLADFARKDVWDIKFAEDNPHMFAIMEKTRMFIFDGFKPEPAVQTSTYICEFNDLEVLGVLLDELVASAEQPTKDCLLRLSVKTLRDCQLILEKDGPAKALEYIEANPHPRLKRLLAETCLEQGDLDMAELGFVHCQNYTGIQFVKRLRNIQSKLVRKAEIKPYFGKVDEAEQLLLNSDRSDLAIELRRRLGDWFRVAQLAKDSGALVKDTELAEIWNAIGDHFADQMIWDKAASYYRQGGDLNKFAECLYQLEDYSGLERLIEELPDGHTLLPELAMRFASIGLAQQAVYALVKCNRIKEAIDVCLELNHWQMALELVGQQNGGASNFGGIPKHQYEQQRQKIDRMLTQAATRLVEQGRRIQAVELYKRAGRLLAAAQLMFQEAQEASKRQDTTPLQLKKMYVLIGLLMEQYYEQSKMQAAAKAKSGTCAEGVLQASSALAGLLLEEQERTTAQSMLDTTEETSVTDVAVRQDEREKNIKNSLWEQALSRARKTAPVTNEKILNQNLDELSDISGPNGDRVLEQNLGERQKTAASDKNVGMRDNGRLIDQPWRRAEAYHFLLLAERQLYAGAVDHALRTSQLLRDYEDILDPKATYSLIALCAISARAFATCSKAFIKLENLPDISPYERELYEKMALEIFTRHPPINEQKTNEASEMDSMLESESKIPICVVTGQPVTDYQFWMCPTCKHSAYEQEIARIRNCPLCHFPVQ